LFRGRERLRDLYVSEPEGVRLRRVK